MKTKSERREWLLNYIKDSPFSGVDILQSDFVDEYIRATSAAYTTTCWGAYKCRQLGVDLSAMAKLGLLRRSRLGLRNNWQPGFPRWVWVYEVSKAAAEEETCRNIIEGKG